MDWNARFMTAVIVVFASMSLLVAGLWWSLGRSTPPLLDPPADSQAFRATRVSKRQTYPRGLDTLRVNARVEELEEQLQRSTHLVAAKNAALEQLQQEMSDLREQLRESEEFSNLLVAAAQNLVIPATNDDAPAAESPAPPAEPSAGADAFVELEPMPEDPVGELLAAPAQLPSATELELQRVRTQLANREADILLERMAKAEVMQAIGASAIDGLIASLQSSRPEVRAWACSGLTELGPEAAEAFDALQPLLNDPVPRVRDQAAIALRSIQE